MADIDETRLNGIESRVTKIEEYIECSEKTKEQEWKTGINKKLEEIGGNLKTVGDRQIRAGWQWPFALGLASAAIGYNFFVTGANPIASIILMIVGLLLMVAAPFVVKKSKSSS